MAPTQTMTIDTFLEELSRVSDRFRWMLVPDDGWHSERRGQTRFRLRGTPRSGSARLQALDPVIALCYARTGTRESWLVAMDELELSPGVAERLIAAANDCVWTEGPEGRRQDEVLKELRVRLIRGVGLPAPASS